VLDHVQQAVPDVVRLCLATTAQGLVDEEHGRPCTRLRPGTRRAWTTGQRAGLDELVRRGNQWCHHWWQDKLDRDSTVL
jgi:hypothetical protein